MTPISKFTFSAYDCADPWGLLKYYIPINFTNRTWKPEPIMDQVTATFSFRTEEDKSKYEDSLPVELKRFLVKDNF